MWDLLRVQKRWVRLMIVALLGSSVASLTVAQLTVAMVDRGIIEQSVRIERFLLAAIILTFFSAVVQFGLRQVGARIGFHIEYVLRTRLYRAIQSAELKRLDRMAGGQLVARSLTDVAMIERFMAFAPSLIGILPLMLGLGIFLVILHPLIGLLAMFSLPFNIWMLRRFRHRLKALSWSELNERAEIAAAIDEPIRGIRVVKAFGREDKERARVAAVALRTYRFGMTRWRLVARYDIPMKIVPVVIQAIVLLIGAGLVADGSLSLGTFVLAFQFVTALSQAAQIVDEIASIWQYLHTAQSRVSEVLALAEEPSTEGRPLPPAGRGIEIEGAGVQLGGRSVLAGVDLRARPGRLVVVTGAPGSGKSTLAAAAAGILPLDDGRVLLDGADIRELLSDDVAQSVKIVSEDSFTFAATIRENLELGVPGHAEEAALRRALWAAGADDFVDDLPGGLDNHVGDRGLTLSGGQRQRIALARALVSPPRVLVLDDALSAVNPSLEVEILRRTREAAPETALICISRRQGATTIADEVVTLPDPPELVDAVIGADQMPLEVGGAPLPPTADGLSALGFAPEVLEAIAGLKVTDEDPGVPEDRVLADEPPTFGLLLRVFKVAVAVAAVALVLQTLGRLGPELMFGDVADLVEDGDASDVPPRAFALMLIGLAMAGTAYAFRIFMQRFNQGSLLLLRRRVFQRLSRLGVDFYDREMPGEVASRVVYDLDVLSRFLETSLFFFLSQVALILVGMALIIAISPALVPLMVIILVIVGLVSVVQYPIVDRAYERARDELGRVVTKFEEDVTARHDIRSFGATEKQMTKFERAALGLRSQRRRTTAIANGFNVLLGEVGSLVAILVMYFGGLEVLSGAVSVGSVLTLRLLSSQMAQPLQSLGRYYSQLIEVRVSFNRLKQPWDVEILPASDPTARGCPLLAGAVRFDDIVFAYPHTGREVLHGVSFEIPARSVTSLVGYTGAGKSSIAKLLSRTYDPDGGAVQVDGHDLRGLDLDSYRPNIGVVPQDAFLFKGTVASNIAYGKPGAAPAEIEAAARAVGAHDMLAGLSDGYDHPVEEEARNLTAAQRQLIALARAWIASPSVLVLDEATSCLDARLEQRVLDAVGRLGCTTLMVTHRDNVARSSDHVVVLDAGRVAESGPPRDLVGAGGAYDRLWVAVPESPDPVEPEPAR